MVRHVIIWKLKENIAEADKVQIKATMKEKLEGLVGVVPGLVEMHIATEPLTSSNGEVMLDSLLESEEALKNYAVHPEHMHVAVTYVRPYTEVRMCMDFEV